MGGMRKTSWGVKDLNKTAARIMGCRSQKEHDIDEWLEHYSQKKEKKESSEHDKDEWSEHYSGKKKKKKKKKSEHDMDEGLEHYSEKKKKKK